MKIYFVRHGESFDDIYNEFGSWSDRGLTPSGIKTAFELAEKLKTIENKIDIILSSPLPRALETAKIISSELNVKQEEEPFLKERNTYGLLTGVNKDLAVEEYPEMNAAFLEGRYIPGAEKYKDCVERVNQMIKRFAKMKYEKVVCVTHGHIMTIIIEEMFGKTRNSIREGGILGAELTKKGDIKMIYTEGLTFTTDETVTRAVELRKFKKE